MDTTTIDALLAGTGYQAVRLLGQGGAAVVWEAVELAGGGRVALKVLHPSLTGDEDARLRLIGEAEILEHLEHPNIVRCHGCRETSQGTPMVVMECLKGQALASTESRPLLEAIRIVRAVASALEYAHSFGLVHRDLKIQNILLHLEANGDLVPKLLDWHIAKRLPFSEKMGIPAAAVATEEGLILGTPRVISPEGALLQAVDQRSDIYNLGWLLFTLATGRVPYQALSGADKLLIAHAMQPTELPSALAGAPIPAELDAIVLRATAKEPAQRYQTTADFARALVEVELDMQRPAGWMQTTTFVEASEAPEATEMVIPQSSKPPSEASSRTPALPDESSAPKPREPLAARADGRAGHRSERLVFIMIFLVTGATIAALVAWSVAH
jgi:serine/threonine-protein kinase